MDGVAAFWSAAREERGSGVSRHSVPARTWLLSQGEHPDHLIYIETGHVALRWASAEGRELLVDLVGPGGCIGEECLIEGRPAAASAEAVDDLVIWRVDSVRARLLLSGGGTVARDFVLTLLDARQRAHARIVVNLTLPLEKRLAALLLSLAPRTADGQLTPIRPRLTRERLATLLDASRPQVSTLMTRFRRAGLVAERRGELRVMPALLRHASASPFWDCARGLANRQVAAAVRDPQAGTQERDVLSFAARAGRARGDCAVEAFRSGATMRPAIAEQS